MKVIDLFSGIGGFTLGLESTGGFQTIQFVENEIWCQKILAKNFPGISIAGDIREYEGQRADVVVGGFPCQPFSVAGKRKGTRDDRHLWPEMLRVIKESKPRWVIGENVRNLTTIQEGMVFEQVCTDLENEGYQVQSFIIPASAVNAPHQRYRVWIVGYSEHNGSQERCEETRGEKRESKQGWMLESKRTSTSQTAATVADSESNKQDGIPRETQSEYDKRNSWIVNAAVTDSQSDKPNKMWPTPRSAKGMHFKLTENMEKLHHKKYLETEVAYTDKPRGGHLNPEWVEWLMGYPIGWTDLKD